MITSETLLNYKEVGFVVVINPPLTPANSINAIELESQLNEWVDNHKFQLTVDCAGIDYVYSDTLNALVRVSNRIASIGGVVSLVHASENIERLVSNILSKHFLLFKNEPEIMAFSLRNEPPEVVFTPDRIEEKSHEAPKAEAQALKVEAKAEVLVPKQTESEFQVNAIEMAKIEAQKKMELRQAKAASLQKQKKIKLKVFGAFALLTLATALYLWSSGMLAKWLNEFIPGLF